MHTSTNVLRFSAHAVTAVTATTLADRAEPNRSATSPNSRPGPSLNLLIPVSAAAGCLPPHKFRHHCDMVLTQVHCLAFSVYQACHRAVCACRTDVLSLPDLPAQNEIHDGQICRFCVPLQKHLAKMSPSKFCTLSSLAPVCPEMTTSTSPVSTRNMQSLSPAVAPWWKIVSPPENACRHMLFTTCISMMCKPACINLSHFHPNQPDLPCQVPAG